MTLITGYTCPPTIYFKFITKCDKCYYKVRQLFLLQSAIVCYYKVRQLFYYKVQQVLLQSATGIAKCDNFITKCDDYYKVRQYMVTLKKCFFFVELKNPSPYSPLSYTRDIFRDEKKPKILETSSGAKFEVSLQLNGMP